MKTKESVKHGEMTEEKALAQIKGSKTEKWLLRRISSRKVGGKSVKQ